MKKKAGDFFRDEYPNSHIVTQTPARANFGAARGHAITLLRIHDEKTGRGKGRPAEELEALKRSAVILAVTAWESFVEDTVTSQLEARLKAAKDPAELQSTFNSVAEAWLGPQEEKKRKRFGPHLAGWAGEKWKDRIRDSLSDELNTFNTPSTKNTNGLFERYLDKAIKDSWHWQRVKADKAQFRLDQLIELRGNVAHHGKRSPLSAQVPTVLRGTAVDALNLVYNLVDATEKTLGISPSSHAFGER
jgi:hypothetical protein